MTTRNADTTPARALALLNHASSTTVAVRALAAAILDNSEFGECPVQRAIALALLSVADEHEAAEKASM